MKDLKLDKEMLKSVSGGELSEDEKRCLDDAISVWKERGCDKDERLEQMRLANYPQEVIDYFEANW